MRLVLLAFLAVTTTACVAHDDRPRRPHGPRGAPRGTHAGPRGRLFVSPMGAPFRSAAGEVDPETRWFAAADTDHDGRLTEAEFSADAMRFFAQLDRGHDGEIDPDDITAYETDLLPEVRVAAGGGGGGGRAGGGHSGGHSGGRRGGSGSGSGGDKRGGGGFGGRGGGIAGGDAGDTAAPRQPDDSQAGAARFALFDYPEPITPLDTNFNRGISQAEFQAGAEARFALLDATHSGAIRLTDLPRVSAEGSPRPHRPGRPGLAPVKP